MKTDLSILIVTYNSAPLIAGLLDELHRQLDASSGIKADVIVVDNASTDATADLIAHEYRWVSLVRSARNLGFAAGNNLAARRARGEFLLLLNPDAVPAPAALAAGVELMRAHPQVGLGGGKLLAPDGTPQPSARMFPTLRDELFTMSGLAARYPQSPLLARLDRRWADPELAAAVDWIPGAFVFIRRNVWDTLGGFDERFFMYYEEVDLCRRLQDKGLIVQYWPTLKATHIGGASARTVARARVSRAGSQLESWRMRSALLYYRKHHGPAAAWGWKTLESCWTLLRRFRNRAAGRVEQLQELRAHSRQLDQAWHDTRGGRLSPAKPW
jgi:GT2 family glycosyltransferase